MAKYDIELAEYNARLVNIREKIKEERNLKVIPKNAGELLVNVKDRLRKLSCSVKCEFINKGHDTNFVEISIAPNEVHSSANELT